MPLLSAVLAAVLILVSPAAAQKRVALVIGNGKYQHEGQLANPANDARAVAAALKRIAFDDVQVVLDGDLKGMQAALATFARSASGADLAMVYYSGHGIEVDGQNYLVPTDARLGEAGDVDFEAVPLELVLRATDRARKVKMVVLDACRNNPFAARMVQQQGKRSIGRGLAMPPASASSMLVAYAARAGTTADDGPRGGNSPFTAAFLQFVEQPRVEIRRFFGLVRDAVLKSTSSQEPFIYGSLGGDEVFLNPAGAVIAPPMAPQAASPASPPTYIDYVKSFESGQPALHGAAFSRDDMGPLAASVLESGADRLKSTHWQGGDSWGRIQFDGTGRLAKYALGLPGEPGELVLTGVLGDSGRRAGGTRAVSVANDVILLAEWKEDQNRGGMILRVAKDEIKVSWGPRFLRESTWKRQETVNTAAAVVPSPAPGLHSDASLKETDRPEVQALPPGSGKSARDCYDDDPVRNRACPEMVVVPAGSFTMGSFEHDTEKPPRPVTIGKPFAVGKFEVTFEEWAACAAGGGCAGNPNPDDSGWGRARRPVINVSWFDAKEYVNWLSGKTGKRYRLLSEAEWEYAARAGTTTKTAYGDALSRMFANFTEAYSNVSKQTEAVGSYRPNFFGLHDIHGNVWELTEDNWHPNYSAAPQDGSVWSGGDPQQKVARGGGFTSYGAHARSSARVAYHPGYKNSTLGFRVARDLD